MATTQKGAGKTAQYLRYKNHNHYAKNKTKRIERAIKKFPDNEALKTALNSVGSYSRKAAKTRVWGKTKKRVQEIYNIFSKFKTTNVAAEKVAYSMGARALYL